jgi:predicted histone-like DNA-binding protein
MARSVTYSVVPRKNPQEKGTPPKFYAQAQARGDVNIREMSERIQSACTVNKADVYAVLVALEDVIAEALQNGEIVRLGELCTLQVSLSGKGALTEEDYNDSLIKKAKIIFRPGTILAGAL